MSNVSFFSDLEGRGMRNAREVSRSNCCLFPLASLFLTLCPTTTNKVKAKQAHQWGALHARWHIHTHTHTNIKYAWETTYVSLYSLCIFIGCPSFSLSHLVQPPSIHRREGHTHCNEPFAQFEISQLCSRILLCVCMCVCALTPVSQN